MGELSLTVWRRYGHDRIYVSRDQSSLGYLNRATGELVLQDNAARTEVLAALVDAGHLPNAAGAPRVPPSPVPPPRPATAPRVPRGERALRRQQANRTRFARQSWAQPTLSEKALADELLRSSPFVWQREVPRDRYRLDFYCAAARLAVEVDGSSHRGKAEADRERDEFFRAAGIETLRIPAAAVERDCAAVVAALNRHCIARTGSVPRTEVPAPGLVARLLGRTQRVERQALAPEEYVGKRRGGQFVCARCRATWAAGARSTRATNCCVRCAG